MAAFQMTIAANNLHGDYQLANGYGPAEAKAVLTVSFIISERCVTSSQSLVQSFIP